MSVGVGNEELARLPSLKQLFASKFEYKARGPGWIRPTAPPCPGP